jgi:hypothetical protein
MLGFVKKVLPPRVCTSEYHQRDFFRYNEHVERKGFEFQNLFSSLFWPTVLKRKMGYVICTVVSLPVQTPAMDVNRDFDTLCSEK